MLTKSIIICFKYMAYRERITPWVVVRLLPGVQRIMVGRFRSRSDAEGHLKVLRSQIPNAEFVVMFDPGFDDEEV